MNHTEKQAISGGSIPREMLTKTTLTVLEERYRALQQRGYCTEYQYEKKELRRFVKLGSQEVKRAELSYRYQIYPDFFEFPPKDHDHEPNRIADFKLDLDKDGNIPLVIEEAHKILDNLFKQYGVNPNEWRIWFSGGKGVHLEILASVLGLEDGRKNLPLVFKALAREFVEKLGLETVDLSIYCMKTGKPFRREGIQRENGNYKVPVTLEELTAENHDSFIKAPRHLEDGRPGLRSEKLAARIQEIIAEIESKEAFINSGAFFEYESEDDPPCITAIANNRRVTAGKCDFNFSAMTLIRYVLSRGWTCDDVMGFFPGFIAEFPSSSLTTLAARKANITDRFHSMERSGAVFNCGFARALGIRLGCESCSYFNIDYGNRKEAFFDSVDKSFIQCQEQNKSLQSSVWVPKVIENGFENDLELLDTLKKRFKISNPAAALKEGLKHKMEADLVAKAATEGKVIVYVRVERSLMASDIVNAILLNKGDNTLFRCNGRVCYVDDVTIENERGA